MCVCVCVCVCVCLRVNHSDLIQGLSCERHYIPGWVASHSKDPWWFPNTLSLIVIKDGQSQRQWRRSCSSRRQFGQIGSCEGSSRLTYCLREGWWPDRRRARRTSSFLFLICFASRETLRCWYTKATRSCIGKASRIVSLITWMDLDRETGRTVSVTMVLASLATLSARSLPGMAEWPGIESIEWKWKTIWILIIWRTFFNQWSLILNQ